MLDVSQHPCLILLYRNRAIFNCLCITPRRNSYLITLSTRRSSYVPRAFFSKSGRIVDVDFILDVNVRYKDTAHFGRYTPDLYMR